MKKVVLPTDFSENAWKAISYATTLYKNLECEFYLLNVFSIDSFSLSSILPPEPGLPVYDYALGDSQMKLEDLRDKLIYDKNPKHRYELVSKYNSLTEALKNLVNKKDIDIIIMGTKGATDSINVLYGSNALDVMENITGCPVLVVPDEAHAVIPKEIVFTTSLKHYYKQNELISLFQIVELSKANVKILHVLEKEKKLSNTQEEIKNMLLNIFQPFKHSFHILVSKGEPEIVIAKFTEENKSDMIALVNRKHNFLTSIIGQTFTEEMGLESKIPLLIMHHSNN